MKTQNLKNYIETIRKEAIELGYANSTINGYVNTWQHFIKWKNTESFEYNEDDYSRFLLEYYNFDVNTYTNESKSFHQFLMRSKRMLDNFEEYNQNMNKKVLPSALYKNYPSEWEIELKEFLDYCKNVRQNSIHTIEVKESYLKKLFSYFYQHNIDSFRKLDKKIIVTFINDSIEKGNRSKERYFYILRELLDYFLMENIIGENLSIYIPKIKKNKKRRLPTYFSSNEVDKILSSIPKERKPEIRDYAIILIAARLGLRISDILNIKLKNIDWVNSKITVIQEKNHNLNVLPLTKEVGWAVIDYIKKSRPKTSSEYLFVKMKYPFEKMEQFTQYNKYFEKSGIETNNENKKGIHNFRHSLATNMLENGIPLDIIASTLGDSIETTANTYLKVAHKQLKECVLEVNE